jgi:hypothetical protein
MIEAPFACSVTAVGLVLLALGSGLRALGCS